MNTAGQVATPLTFPCGLTLQNRLIKAAMAEGLAIDGNPDAEYAELYTQWGNGGWGAVMTGNVMVDAKYLGGPGSTTISQNLHSAAEDAAVSAWSTIASRIKGANGTAALMQINHPGKQSPIGSGSRRIWAKNLAPSAIPLDLGSDLITRSLVKVLFGTPAELTIAQIEDIVASFVNAAKVAQKAGFDGVEIHAAHGYLLSDFLSPKANRRTDAYGGSPEKRAFIIVRIVQEMRQALGSSFCISVKMNSSDQQADADFEEVLQQVAVLAAEAIDFLEISGGSYEDPRMVHGDTNATATKSTRGAKREAYFIDFATQVRNRHPKLHLMLTGGFRTRSAMNSALESDACSIIGVGRPAAVVLDFPRSVIGIDAKQPLADGEAGLQLDKAAEPWLVKYLPSPQLRRAVSGGAETQFYSAELKKVAQVKVNV